MKWVNAHDVTKLIDSMSEVSEELINNAEETLGSVHCNPKDYYSLLTHEHKLRNDKFEPF